MENVVCTLPISPKRVTDVKTKIDPILVDFIGTSLNYRKALVVNVLNAYNDKSEYLNSYLKKLNDDGIIFDDLYCDKHYLTEIIARIYKMIDEKTIVEASDDLLRCSCGKVDLPKRAVRQNEN